MNLASAPLESRHVRLVPFDTDVHSSALRDMAERSGERLATWPYYDPPGDWISEWKDSLRRRTTAGNLIPFAVFVADGQFAGLTSYLNPDAASQNVEIGMTIYAPEFQRRAINPACKLLLLDRAFEAGAVRVYFNVDERNVRSQGALIKLGATREGLLRDNRILANGYLRSTVVFSILAREWPTVKTALQSRLEAFGRDQ